MHKFEEDKIPGMLRDFIIYYQKYAIVGSLQTPPRLADKAKSSRIIRLPLPRFSRFTFLWPRRRPLAQALGRLRRSEIGSKWSREWWTRPLAPVGEDLGKPPIRVKLLHFVLLKLVRFHSLCSLPPPWPPGVRERELCRGYYGNSLWNRGSFSLSPPTTFLLSSASMVSGM